MNRRTTMVMMILTLGLPLWVCAQQLAPRYSILIMPFVAEAGLVEEARQLYPMLFDELEFQGAVAETFTAVRAGSSSGDPEDPDFMLSSEDAAINPRYIVTVNLERSDGVRVFTLRAIKAADGSALTFQLPYEDTGEFMQNLAFFAWNFSANLPRDPPLMAAGAGAAPPVSAAEPKAAVEEDSAWKNKWLYLGLQGGLAPGFYITEVERPLPVGLAYGAGFRAEFQFVHWYWPGSGNYLSFSFETGADLMMDTVVFQAAANVIPLSPSSGVNTTTLLFPGVLRVNYKPGHYALGVYGGAYYILPLNGCTVDPPLGVTAGFKAGIKTGPGILSLNFRYSGDLGLSDALEAPGIQFRRYILFFGLGYEFGFFNRIKRTV